MLIFFVPSLSRHFSRRVYRVTYRAEFVMLLNGYYNIDTMSNKQLKECSICSDVIDDNNCVQWLQCFHGFHQECISKWLQIKQQCPICNFSTKLDITDVNENGEFISATGEIIDNGQIKNKRITPNSPSTSNLFRVIPNNGSDLFWFNQDVRLAIPSDVRLAIPSNAIVWNYHPNIDTSSYVLENQYNYNQDINNADSGVNLNLADIERTHSLFSNASSAVSNNLNITDIERALHIVPSNMVPMLVFDDTMSHPHVDINNSNPISDDEYIEYDSDDINSID